ncbi:DUF547 domain-containing protein [Kolteria novifilia]
MAMVLLAVVGWLDGVRIVFAGGKIHVGGSCPGEERPSLDEVDYSIYDKLLHRYVEHGLVDYAAWKAHPSDRASLTEFLEHAGCVDLSKSASREAKLAYWINLYNALTLEGILREYPTTSIRNHTSFVFGYNIWKDLLLTVDDEEFSLSDIEHKVLRKMGEPRIHFAIVCASLGCPKLRSEAYVPGALDEQLSDSSRDFFAQTSKFRYESRTKTFRTSRILSWFAKDFGSSTAERLRTIAPYLPDEPARQAARRGEGSFAFLSYDWDLNGR